MDASGIPLKPVTSLRVRTSPSGDLPGNLPQLPAEIAVWEIFKGVHLVIELQNLQLDRERRFRPSSCTRLRKSSTHERILAAGRKR
jgi:hypothetical protein